MANLSLILGSSGLLGFILMFFWIGRWMGKIDSKLNSLDEIKNGLKEVKISVQSLEVRMSRLETQDEERFRNEIKLLVSERRGQGG